MILDVPSQILADDANVAGLTVRMGVKVGWMDKVLGKKLGAKENI